MCRRRIAGKKNYVGLEGLGLGHETATELRAIDGPEVQIAQQHRAPATPGRRKAGKLDRDAADANDARIQEAVETREDRDCVKNAGEKQACGSGMGRGRHQLERKPKHPGQQRRPEKEVEKAKPDGGQPVNEPDG